VAFLPLVIFESRIDVVGFFNLKDVLKFKLVKFKDVLCPKLCG